MLERLITFLSYAASAALLSLFVIGFITCGKRGFR